MKVGDTRREVEQKLGPPKSDDTTYFDQNCKGLQDTYRYPARSQGDLAQTCLDLLFEGVQMDEHI